MKNGSAGAVTPANTISDKDILTKAQALYNDRTSQGYQPYQGPTIAEFTPEQQQVQAGRRSST